LGKSATVGEAFYWALESACIYSLLCKGSSNLVEIVARHLMGPMDGKPYHGMRRTMKEKAMLLLQG
jgi:hypothetical protein